MLNRAGKFLARQFRRSNKRNIAQFRHRDEKRLAGTFLDQSFEKSNFHVAINTTYINVRIM